MLSQIDIWPNNFSADSDQIKLFIFNNSKENVIQNIFCLFAQFFIKHINIFFIKHLELFFKILITALREHVHHITTIQNFKFLSLTIAKNLNLENF